MDWEKALRIATLASLLAERHREIPRTDAMNLHNAVETKNETQFMEHLIWILKAIHINEIEKKDKDAEELVRLVNELF
jgi:hypothetical protein